MSYFTDHYNELRLPIDDDAHIGFRLAQLAAIHAVSAHFFGSRQPAIVTMPTGSGKSAVLAALPFLLRPQRVLVLTPSRLVREQLADNLRLLLDLKKLNAVPEDLEGPRVFTTDGIIGSDGAWDSLRHFDVVVATVPSVSPREGVIPLPPTGLFDLVLVDEAHHSPAKTWSDLLNSLRDTQQVLFTATPFRRDDKEIKGKFVFTYDLRRATDDRVFGDITFEPVHRPSDASSADIAIATATEARFRADRAAGFDHLIMVRTDSLSRAKALVDIYQNNTALRLAFVNGQHSLGHVKRIVARLQQQELDGIICVNMFGEGFNLPDLKIAAIHSPHKSLAVTLQFIGRFARTGQAHIGQATFLAEPASSGAEIDELYEADAVWRTIVQNLGAARLDEEVRTREVLDSFEVNAAPDMEDFSLYTVTPYFHTKIFATPDGADLAADPNLPSKLQIIYKGVSHPHGAVVYLTREAVRSRWSTDARFTNIAYDLFIFHHNPETELLFICSSRRNAKLYMRLVRNLVNGRPRPLSNSRINRALNDLEAAEFFSVGMRKRHGLGQFESYRTITGPSGDKVIQETDARLFDRGHCFGKALDDGAPITIGVSSASKVWSNTSDQIPELLNWCDRLAAKIATNRAAVTGSRLDLLSVGEELTQVPSGIIAMIWPPTVYYDPPAVYYSDALGNPITRDLLDFALEILTSEEGSTTFAITNEDLSWRGIYSLSNDELFTPATPDEPEFYVHHANEDMTLQEYLNEDAPTFFCSDLSAIETTSRFPARPTLEVFNDDLVEVVDWSAAAVNIEKEKPGNEQGRSLFEWLQERLVASDASVVFCDDAAGEIADYIAIHETVEGTRVKLFHCKASSGPTPGNRIKDLNEVCSQAIRSSVWIRTDHLFARLQHRVTLPSVIGYVKGDEQAAARALARQAQQQTQFEVYIVQPMVQRDGRQANLATLLAATRDYLVQGGIWRFGVIGSGTALHAQAPTASQ